MAVGRDVMGWEVACYVLVVMGSDMNRSLWCECACVLRGLWRRIKVRLSRCWLWGLDEGEANEHGESAMVGRWVASGGWVGGEMGRGRGEVL